MKGIKLANHDHGWPEWAIALLLFALLVRGLVPAGWMPAMASNGPQLIICTAQGLAATPDSIGLQDDNQAPPATADQGLCLFACLGVPLLPLLAAGSVGISLLIPERWSSFGTTSAVFEYRSHSWPPAQAPPPRA